VIVLGCDEGTADVKALDSAVILNIDFPLRIGMPRFWGFAHIPAHSAGFFMSFFKVTQVKTGSAWPPTSSGVLCAMKT
jgi:hypothetical protein